MRNTNSLKEEIRLVRKQMKDWSFSKKIEYCWDYYKYHFIIIVVLSLLLGNFIHGIITKKETVLSIAYINAFPNIEDAEFIEDFEKYLNLNSEKQEVALDSDYYIDPGSPSPYAANYQQKFSARCMAGMLDVVLADEENFLFYGKQSFFMDLRQVLSREELERYDDLLLYCDLEKEQGKDVVPIGINITNAPKISSTDSYPSSTAYFGIVNGCEKSETALAYLSYLGQ